MCVKERLKKKKKKNFFFLTGTSDTQGLNCKVRALVKIWDLRLL